MLRHSRGVPLDKLVSDDVVQHRRMGTVGGCNLRAERAEPLNRALLVRLRLLVHLAAYGLLLRGEELVHEEVVALHQPADRHRHEDEDE